MGEKPINPFPYSIEQNPAPAPETGQEVNRRLQEQVELIMTTFLAVLPDNYVSQVNGPFYTLQFQAIAESLAKIQLTAQEATLDGFYDFTRPEFLWQILGAMVFPGSGDFEGNVPVVPGDVSYREFLQRMVLLLLRGATPDAVVEGAGLLTSSSVTILEKFLSARDPGSGWGLKDQFEFEINVETDGGTQFPSEPFILQQNVQIILEALKPAHTLYEYRHLFRETFGPILFQESLSWELELFRYEDFRKFCCGIKEIRGEEGQNLAGGYLFQDLTRSFKNVRDNSELVVLTGPNTGKYHVVEIRIFVMGDDPILRPYTTSPSGLTGYAKVSGDRVTDTSQDFSVVVEGEILTFTSGPNTGSYRMDFLLGPDGGPLEHATGAITSVRMAPSLLRTKERFLTLATNQTYVVSVDRLGVQEVHEVTLEDVSDQFYL